jgi:hypothetical protein
VCYNKFTKTHVTPLIPLQHRPRSSEARWEWPGKIFGWFVFQLVLCRHGSFLGRQWPQFLGLTGDAKLSKIPSPDLMLIAAQHIDLIVRSTITQISWSNLSISIFIKNLMC